MDQKQNDEFKTPDLSYETMNMIAKPTCFIINEVIKCIFNDMSKGPGNKTKKRHHF